MTYLVLARKYRPRDFSQVIGQDHVVRALTHALTEQRLHHAYLFTGTRGVGKTSLSRILAKALNCLGVDGRGDITATPCGVCEACVAIDGGRFVDYVEMDAASNRGVDEMTAVLERAAYAPSAARFKVTMIDEVHMLSNHAFNAMLKTLEEPPPHLKFILATTDPQKVPVTVLSRCLQFNLKQMPPPHIAGHLTSVLQTENIDSEPNALRLLAQAAQGSMRDALSLTDQAIAYAAGPLTETAVRAMLGAVDARYLIQIAEALLAEDGPALMRIADAMVEQSLSFDQGLRDLALLFQRIAIAQRVPEAIPADLPEAADITRLAQAFDAEETQLNYQIAITGRNELALAPDEYAGFTMTLLRMLAFRPGRAREAEPARRAAGLTAAIANRSTTMAEAGERAISGQTAASSDNKPRPLASALLAQRAPSAIVMRAPAQAYGDRAVATMNETEMVMEVAPPLDHEAANRTAEALSRASSRVRAEAAPAKPSVESTASAVRLESDWPSLVAQLDIKGVARELARQSEWVGCEGRAIQLRVANPALAQASQVEKLKTALSAHFGQPVLIAVSIGAVADTGAARASAAQASKLQTAEQAFHGDPIVKQLIEQFGATVVPGSIKPLENS